MARKPPSSSTARKGEKNSTRATRSKRNNDASSFSRKANKKSLATRVKSSRKVRKSVRRQRPSKQKLSELKIRRTSGRVERYDKDMMAKTLSRSGTPFVMARDIAKTVSEKIIASSSSPNSLMKEKKDAKKGKASNKRSTRRIEKVVDGSKVRELIAEELESRNRPDIASSYKGERPENTRQDRYDLAKGTQPVHENMTSNLSNLVNDNATHLAKSTKVRRK